jgi:uncharacterized lipoprotein YddW (UPF0748 family)
VQNPGRFSLSPATIDFALNNYAVDWVNWAQLRLFSKFYPQLYDFIFTRAFQIFLTPF